MYNIGRLTMRSNMPANVFLKLRQCVQSFCQLYFPELLKIRVFEILANFISRNVGNYNSPTYWQLYFPEMLAITFCRHAGDKC